MMLFQGNTKLGGGIWTFSLPAGHTCPGLSETCARYCYAKQGAFGWPSVQGAYGRNWESAQAPDFVKRMRGELLANNVKVCRIHVSGDFYDAAYVTKWLKIVQASRGTRFYAYTRSWKEPKILAKLRELAREKNMHLWFSADRDMPEPPRIRGIKIAYMATSNADVPERPVDLVFRTNRYSVRKFMGGSLVCPVEQGVKRKIPVTCERCRICFDVKQAALAKAAGRRQETLEV